MAAAALSALPGQRPAIAATGSISESARRLGMSYRRAWLLVDVMNRTFRTPLVHSSAGGRAGGGAGVTDEGRKVLAKFRELEQAREILAQAGLGAAGGFRQGGKKLVDIGVGQIGVAARRADEVQRKAILVIEHRLDEVFRQDLRMAAGKRARLGALYSCAGALGIAFEVHELCDPLRSSRQARGDPEIGASVNH